MIPYDHLPYIILANTLITIAIIALFYRIKKKHKQSALEIKPVEIQKGPGVSMQVWQAVYQQSAESLRDQAKLLASINIAGLAGAVAILSSSRTVNTGWLITSVSVFGLGLIVSLMPITGLADKFKEDLTSIMAEMSDEAKESILIHHTSQLGKRFYVGVLSLVCSSLGVTALTKALLP